MASEVPFLLVEFTSDLVSTIFLAVGLYYGVRLIRLTKGLSTVALTRGRGPVYLALALLAFFLNRIMDFLMESVLWPNFGLEVALVLDDPPAALTAVFMALGLREMYKLYREAPHIAETEEIKSLY